MGGTLALAELGREGAAPAFGFPKNPASVVCLVLSCISAVSLGIGVIKIVDRMKKRRQAEVQAQTRMGGKGKCTYLSFGISFAILLEELSA